MDSPDLYERRAELVRLSRELGREDRGMAILGEGNASVGCGDELLVKASGRSMGSLEASGLVRCRREPLLEMLDGSDLSDDAIEQGLLGSRVDLAEPKPSVEAVFHAYLLGLPGVEWVGHTHSIAVNRILCSTRAAEFARGRVFPDEVVCCGEESVFVPYVDPGLPLAREIRQRTRTLIERRGGVPRVILLGNHGVITLGPTPQSVLAAMLMVQKAAEIWLGAAVLGGPVYLGERDVARIAGRSDEHYRQRALNL